jgi:hypothetical protein
LTLGWNEQWKQYQEDQGTDGTDYIGAQPFAAAIGGGWTYPVFLSFEAAKAANKIKNSQIPIINKV